MFPSSFRKSKSGVMAAILGWGSTIFLNACDGDFDAYNLLNSLRVMAIQASPPHLAPSDSTTLTPLVYTPNGPAQYAWSWCPFAEDARNGFRCFIEEQELRDRLDEVLPGASAFVPSYDLGTLSTATFDYSFDPLVVLGLCEALAETELPDFVLQPECDEGLSITLRLEITDGLETITAVKTITLLFETPTNPNTNPTLNAVRAALEPENTEADETQATELDPTAPFSLTLGSDYRFFVDVPESSADVFTPAPDEREPNPQPRAEDLVLTWFITDGETENIRTTYLPGEIPLEAIRENVWELPGPEDKPDLEAELFLVLRDQRQGVTWIQRRIEFVVP